MCLKQVGTEYYYREDMTSSIRLHDSLLWLKSCFYQNRYGIVTNKANGVNTQDWRKQDPTPGSGGKRGSLRENH